MAYYIGANVDQECLSNCFVDVLKTAGIEAEKLPDGIQYYERVSEAGTRYVFYINASDEEQQIALAGTYLDLIAGQEVRDSITVPALGVAVLEDQDRV